MNVLKILLLTSSANLDVFALGFSYGLKKYYLSFVSIFIVSVLTLLGTFLSMVLGKYISVFFPGITGSIMLILIGFYGLIKTFFKKEHTYPATLKLKEAFVLGSVLAVNNISLGLSSSFMGFNVVITSFFSFFICFLFMIFGNLLGTKLRYNKIGKITEVLANLIIVVLGVTGLVIWYFIIAFLLVFYLKQKYVIILYVIM